jgi:ribokinase
MQPQTPPSDVVGLGTVLVDHLVVLESHPLADTKNPVVSDHIQVGGPVPTALAMLRRLDRRCAFIGAWGDDVFGRIIEADFDSEGIDRSRCVAAGDRRTGFAHVWVCGKTAARTIAYQRTDEARAIVTLDDELLAQTRVLHLDGWPPAAALEAARRAKAAGLTVVLDAGSPKPGTAELLAHVDVVNCPRRFLSEFLHTDDVRSGTKRLRAMGPRIVTVTSGAQGAAIATADGVIERPAFVIDPLDTTGAGDVFTGALIHGVLSAWGPERMLTFAMAAAACKCTAMGNRAALPSDAMIQQMITAAEAAC